MTAATESAFDPIAIGTAIQRRIGVKTVRDEPLARFTTMRVGGPADLFATVHNVHELRALIRFARSRELPHTLLGRGSNVVIADAGIRGLVIQDRAEGSKVDGDRYTAEAGVPMARAATETQRAGLSGLEFGLAIPGTVGGAVWANAGAHENNVAAVLESADVLLADGTEARMPAAELELGYRVSRFKRSRERGGRERRRAGTERCAGRPRPRSDIPPDGRARRRHQGAARRDPPLAAGPSAARAAVRR
jgi:UDP-N-acetylmuramate dehydrogenase